jgi:hypothetical protein
MRALPVIALFAFGCNHISGTAVALSIDAAPSLPQAKQLTLTATGGGRTRSFDLTIGGIPPAVSVTIEVPASISGTFHVDVEAFDSAHTSLARSGGEVMLASGSVVPLPIHLGGQVVEDMAMATDLAAADFAGADLTTPPPADMASGDLATASGDMATASTDMAMVVINDLAVTAIPDLAACVAGMTPPYQVKAGLDLPEHLFVDGNYLYWYSANGFQRTLKDGCGAVETIGPFFAQAGNLVFDANNFFWADSNGVHKCAKSGCANPTDLVTSFDNYYLALQGATLYFVGNSDGRLRTCSTSGCSNTPALISGAGAFTRPGPMAVNSTYVYVVMLSSTPTTADGNIIRCPLAGCGGGDSGRLFMLSAGVITPYDVKANDSEVFFPTYNNHTIEKLVAGAAAPASSTAVLASGSWNPSNIVIDGSFVYASEWQLGATLKCAQSGCVASPTVLSTSSASIPYVAADSSGVYWSDRQSTPNGKIFVYK